MSRPMKRTRSTDCTISSCQAVIPYCGDGDTRTRETARAHSELHAKSHRLSKRRRSTASLCCCKGAARYVVGFRRPQDRVDDGDAAQIESCAKKVIRSREPLQLN